MGAYWWALAVCRQPEHSGTSFFPDEKKLGEVKRLKKICSTCPVKPECLAYAYLHNEQDGIWGGMLYDQRRKFVALVNAPKPLSEQSLSIAVRRTWGMDDLPPSASLPSESDSRILGIAKSAPG